MGRELKRVPMDFDWPLRELWKGYVNPYWKPCPEDGVNCFSGLTAAGEWLTSIASLIRLIGEEASAGDDIRPGRVFPHPYLTSWRYAPRVCNISERTREKETKESRDALVSAYNRYGGLVPLTPQLLDFVERIGGVGHMDLGKILESLLKVAGLDYEWMKCKVCDGHAVHPDMFELHEAWSPEEPPSGDGYQLWESTSEGSPISPVFDSLDELCSWAEENATVFASFRASKEKWVEMLTGGSVVVSLRHRDKNVVLL